MICDGKGTPFKDITTAANINDVRQTLALVDGIPPVAGEPGRPRRRPEAVLGDSAGCVLPWRPRCGPGVSKPRQHLLGRPLSPVSDIVG
ncbi:hypothetical protein [Streptomyces broussonetiae]|uniref:hypothetical protein n=1 Tax=Streptomyces broussonetiae TaxID=2686304 RepID=UPI0035E2BE93